MAPVLSKPAGPTESKGNDWLALLCGKAAEQAREVARDLAEVTDYIMRCVTMETHLPIAISVSQYFGCWTLQSLHQLICEFTTKRAERQSGHEDTEANPTRLVDFMPPAFIAWIISILYSSFVFVYLPSAGLSLASPVSLAFHAMIAMVLASYYKAAVTDPGTIPDSPMWRTFGLPPARLKDRKRSGEARWCRKSEAYKPDRSHYCSATERCVLRMDHFCPWLNNTVGHANHKFFLQFLAYASSACLLGTIKTVQLLASASLPPATVLVLVEAGAIGTLLSSILIPFTTFHCWLLCNNMTTIEFCEQQQQRFATDQVGLHMRHRYDMGLYHNLASVLGSNPLLWLIPVGGPVGDGLSFPMLEDTKESEVEWIDEGSTTASASDGLAACSSSEKYASDRSSDEKLRDPAKSSASEGNLAMAIYDGCAMFKGFMQDAATRISHICCADPQRNCCAATYRRPLENKDVEDISHTNGLQEPAYPAQVPATWMEDSSTEGGYSSDEEIVDVDVSIRVVSEREFRRKVWGIYSDDGYSSDDSEQSTHSVRIVPAVSVGSSFL